MVTYFFNLLSFSRINRNLFSVKKRKNRRKRDKACPCKYSHIGILSRILRIYKDLPLWGAPVLRQKPPCLYVRALIKLKIMLSKEAKLRKNLLSARKTDWGGKWYDVY